MGLGVERAGVEAFASSCQWWEQPRESGLAASDRAGQHGAPTSAGASAARAGRAS